MNIRYAAAFAAVFFALAGLAACGSDGALVGNAGAGAGGKVTFVAYSTPQEAYKEIIKTFTAKQSADEVSFAQSYGASGEQSRAVEAGLPADIVALSLAPDVTRLIELGKVSSDWNNDQFDGYVTKSVVVFAVRKGNPKGIKTWQDLLREDVEVLTPNVFTSGGARWNLMAAYGAQLKLGKSEAEAQKYLAELLRNVSVQDKSARESLQTFSAGKGDVLLAYESEAINAQNNDQQLDYVIPRETILIENPVALTKMASPAAKGFFEYLHQPVAQGIFAKHGFRPVLESEADDERFPVPAELFTIDDLGGWDQAMTKFFDPKLGIVASINRELGTPVD